MPDLSFSSFDAIPDAVLLVDREGTITFANRHASRLFGYEGGELKGQPLAMLIPERHRRAHSGYQEGFAAAPEVRPMGTGRELYGLRKDGSEISVEIALGPARGGELIVAVVRDNSAAAATRRELEISEARLQTASALTADLIWEADHPTDTVQWFGPVGRMLGYPPGEFARTTEAWLGAVHPDDQERVHRAIEELTTTGECSVAYRVRASDGSWRHVEDRARATRRVDGAVATSVGAITDVTERVLRREELERALAEVERLRDQLKAESDYLREEIKESHDFEEIVGNSAALRATLAKLELVAETDASVLILGETGTGKELLARAIHARSRRSDQPLIKVDCANLPGGLVESELFGHQKGAFTGAHHARQGRFELAHRGTVFLDEIGELEPGLQKKLLRVLEDGEFERLGSPRVHRTDVRVIAATNRNLREAVEEGRFRSDLYYRLGAFPLEVPPLRDRREDIPLLTSFFVDRSSAAVGRRIDSIPQVAMERLQAYDWPGNVRELKNVIERAVILSRDGRLRVKELVGAGKRVSLPETTTSLKQSLEEMERQSILAALEECGWRIKGAGNAADRLGLKPSTLRSRMQRLGIVRPGTG